MLGQYNFSASNTFKPYSTKELIEEINNFNKEIKIINNKIKNAKGEKELGGLNSLINFWKVRMKRNE